MLCFLFVEAIFLLCYDISLCRASCAICRVPSVKQRICDTGSDNVLTCAASSGYELAWALRVQEGFLERRLVYNLGVDNLCRFKARGQTKSGDSVRSKLKAEAEPTTNALLEAKNIDMQYCRSQGPHPHDHHQSHSNHCQ